MWRWANFCFSQIPPGVRPLRINFDETAVCLFQGGGPGNLFLSKTDPCAAQHATQAQRRTYLTHVALACDDPEIQPLLPQVVIGNEHSIAARDLAGLQAACPPNVRILRRKSAWVDNSVIAWLVRWLGVVLAPLLGERQPILFFDACRSHIHASVFGACAAARIWAVVIPARLTRLLQPLDTHVFRRYKAMLQEECQAARARSPNGQFLVVHLIPCICACVLGLLQRCDWSGAFDGDGLSAGQERVRDRIKREMQLVDVPVVAATKPTVDELRPCFPRRARINADTVLRPFAKHPPAAAPKAGPFPAEGPRRSPRLALRAARCPPPPRAPARPPASSALGASSKALASRPPLRLAAAVPPALIPRPPKAAGVLTRSRARALEAGR